MSQIPTLSEIVLAIESLALAKRKRAPQGRKPVYSDSFIIALAVYQKLASFRHAQQMLAVLALLGIRTPTPSTFCERKAALLPQIILAVKPLCSQIQATYQHLDSKKLGVVDIARAHRTKLAGSYGHDHVHNTTFYGFRLHLRVDDLGRPARVLLRPANEHDVVEAPRLLPGLSYTMTIKEPLPAPGAEVRTLPPPSGKLRIL